MPGPACYGRGGTEPTLTDVAARYTPERQDNFDIYLPLWLALWALPETHGGHAVLTLLAWALVLLGLTFTFLSLWVWPRWLPSVSICAL